MNNELIIHGTITKLLPMESGFGKTSGKPWSKQTCVLLTDERYPKMIVFDVWNDKVNEFAIKPGESLSVYIDVESREFNGRYYSEIKAWKVDRPEAGCQCEPHGQTEAVSRSGQSPAPQGYAQPPQQGATMQAPPNDLPF